MALEVTYYTGRAKHGTQALGLMISRATVTLSGSSGSLGTIPGGAKIARLTAGENCVVSNNGATSSTNGQYLASGVFIDIEMPKIGDVLYGQTA